MKVRFVSRILIGHLQICGLDFKEKLCYHPCKGHQKGSLAGWNFCEVYFISFDIMLANCFELLR